MEYANAMSEENITDCELVMHPKQAEGQPPCKLNVEGSKVQVAWLARKCL